MSPPPRLMQNNLHKLWSSILYGAELLNPDIHFMISYLS